MPDTPLLSVLPEWNNAYRIINSAFPPISVFEDTLDPADLDIAFALESLTNDRLRDQAGVLNRVHPQDRLCGEGSTPIMAAFTHIGRASRFTDGSYGVYYCANSLDAAIAETRFHQEQFWRATQEASIEITLRTYINTVLEPMIDVRAEPDLHHPSLSSYGTSQAFAKQHREASAWGLLYNSVRLAGHECVAAFRPPALSIPRQGPHFRYVWDDKTQTITWVLQVSEVTF
ncbi:RES family NAD+ phosphorylase [Pseudomonas helleri]|uniref:RES family NAD+ phosphorylase n=1 Tax=Pseudomonas helleri TaxID=1608996 RepID=UPI00242E772C|nr:RES family NAD+ phosphorylase [Pseudomonas helleri]